MGEGGPTPEAGEVRKASRPRDAARAVSRSRSPRRCGSGRSWHQAAVHRTLWQPPAGRPAGPAAPLPSACRERLARRPRSGASLLKKRAATSGKLLARSGSPASLRSESVSRVAKSATSPPAATVRQRAARRGERVRRGELRASRSRRGRSDDIPDRGLVEPRHAAAARTPCCGTLMTTGQPGGARVGVQRRAISSASGWRPPVRPATQTSAPPRLHRRNHRRLTEGAATAIEGVVRRSAALARGASGVLRGQRRRESELRGR